MLEQALKISTDPCRQCHKDRVHHNTHKRPMFCIPKIKQNRATGLLEKGSALRFAVFNLESCQMWLLLLKRLLVADSGWGTFFTTAAAGCLSLLLFAHKAYYDQRHHKDQYRADNDVAEIRRQKIQHNDPSCKNNESVNCITWFWSFLWVYCSPCTDGKA